MAKGSKVANVTPFSRFVRAEAPVKARIIGRSFGAPGTGKTSFWLGAPGPIVIQSLDMGLEGVVEKYQSDKEIYVAEYDWSPTSELSQAEAIDLRDKFVEDFEHAITNARTVLWDRETDIWQLFRYAEFGGPSDAPLNYPQLNQRYRRLLNMPKALDLNFGCIQGLREKWGDVVKPNGKVGARPTGVMDGDGFKELEGIVHVNFEHRRVKSEGRSVFEMEVGKSRGPGSGDVQDQTLTNTTFSEFAQLLFPETEESDWL